MMTLFDDLQRMQERQAALAERLDALAKSSERYDEQINGERGLSAAIRELAQEIEDLRKSVRNVGGMIIASSLGFAISVLAVFG